MSLRKSTSAWRRRLIAEHAAEFEQTVAVEEQSGSTLDAVGWERVERGQWLEVAQSYDPSASLAEELCIRLVGDTAMSSGLRLEWDGLLRPLQEAVSAGSSEDVSLELSGFSKGSSVLHFRAVHREPVELLSDGGPALRETALAGPARRFIDFVDAVENEQDVRMYSKSAMLGGVEKLSDELSRLNLVADFRFYARSGDVRGAKLTSRGMNYVKALHDSEETTATIPVNGRITELRESGHAKVKQGVARNSPAFDVHFDTQTLTGMRLVLGQSVNWLVAVISTKDKLDRVQSTRYEYRRELGHTDQLELDITQDQETEAPLRTAAHVFRGEKDLVVRPPEDGKDP
ncbi:hypothetical protein J2T11_003200 [Paenarthrobacter nicotinovorans]|uniref:hypothetical protein n=1 Tax=Paenarthrobacter nicotinovorans TaxID=29320 RepID=UPI0027816309|nr:hypothetical protein [Paenarthrobacter nicotinovorans]MDP9936832.1 hypothetical protein [Paenarthrobacter nicotinovorans]